MQDYEDLRPAPKLQAQTVNGDQHIQVREKNKSVNLPSLLNPRYPLPEVQEWLIRYAMLFCVGLILPSLLTALPSEITIFGSVIGCAIVICLCAWAKLAPQNLPIAASGFLFLAIGASVSVMFLFL